MSFYEEKKVGFQCFNKDTDRLRAGGPPNESPIKWFDKIASRELQKRKLKAKPIDQTGDMNKPPRQLNRNKRVISQHPVVKDSTRLQFDILNMLQTENESDLMLAIDKFVNAEVACEFDGAVRAAEEAAANVPAYLAEEAAAAGARDFCAEIVDVVNQQFEDRIQPIEVLGYVGITKPKK